MPPDSSSRSKLLAQIDKQIDRLISNEEELTRERAGVRLAVGILVISAVMVGAAVLDGGIWGWTLLPPARVVSARPFLRLHVTGVTPADRFTPQPQGSAADQQERHPGSRQHGCRQYSSRITRRIAVRAILRTMC